MIEKIQNKSNLYAIILCVFHSLTMVFLSSLIMSLFTSAVRFILPHKQNIPAVIVSSIPVIVIFLYAYLYKKYINTETKVNIFPKFPDSVKYILLSAVLALSLLVIASFIQSIINIEGSNPMNNGRTPENSLGVGGPIQLFISVSIFAPISEEIFFRGVLRSIMEKANNLVYILFSSLLFALVHISSLTNVNWTALLTTFVIGVTLSVIAVKKNNIFYTILIHAMYNTVIVIGILYIP